MLFHNAGDHLADVLRWWKAFVTVKYWHGQTEHGGNLWEKPGMLHHTEQEAADCAVYIRTLRLQLEEVQRLLVNQNFERATDLLEDILGEAKE